MSQIFSKEIESLLLVDVLQKIQREIAEIVDLVKKKVPQQERVDWILSSEYLPWTSLPKVLREKTRVYEYGAYQCRTERRDGMNDKDKQELVIAEGRAFEAAVLRVAQEAAFGSMNDVFSADMGSELAAAGILVGLACATDFGFNQPTER